MKPFLWPLCLVGASLAFSQPSARPPMLPPKIGMHPDLPNIAAPSIAAPSIAAPSIAAPNIAAIVQQSLQRELLNARVLENYVYEANEATTTYDVAGHPGKIESKLTEFMWVDGSRYKRLVEENGKRLSGAAAQREQRKLDEELAKRRQEPAHDREKRLAEDARRRQESRQTRDEVVKAFNFRLLGEENVAGVKCWKISADPKPGYEGQTRISRMFPKMRGTIWVHQQGYEWLRVEAETLDAITFGGFLAKLDKGARFSLEQMRINDELWALRQLNTRVTARALLMRFNQGQQIDFRNYRKFSADSRILEAGPSSH